MKVHARDRMLLLAGGISPGVRPVRRISMTGCLDKNLIVVVRDRVDINEKRLQIDYVARLFVVVVIIKLVVVTHRKRTGRN